MNAQTFSWITVVLGALVIVIALADLVRSWRPAAKVRESIEISLDKSDVSQDGLSEQAGTDFSGTWEGLAKLATALKDLDRSSRLLFIGLALLALGGTLIGVEAIAEAIP